MDGDAPDEILRATHRALCEHGYANLTLQDIAAEADMSKATIHYYYDSKAGLITAFLEFLYGEYTDRIESVTGDCQRERLRSLLEVLLANGDEPSREFRTAMVEVRVQAPYDDAIRARLAEFDEVLFEELRAIIADGIDDGEFVESADPELTAEFLTTTISGTQTRHVAVGRSVDCLNEAIRGYVETHLVVDTSEVTH